jgi:hypothetical protein
VTLLHLALTCPTQQVFNTNPSMPEHLRLSLIPEPAGGGPNPLPPPEAFNAPLPARVLLLRRVSTAIRLPPPRVRSIGAAQARVVYAVHGALESVLKLAGASADCAQAVAAAFPANTTSNATQSRETASARARMAGLCRNPCLPRLAAAAGGAARTAAAAWRALELGPDDTSRSADGVLELRGEVALAALADVVRVADGTLITTAVCATGPRGAPCAEAELDGSLASCSPTSPPGVAPGAAALSSRSLLYPSATVPAPGNQVPRAGLTACDAACGRAIDDYAYEEDCCVATRRAAMAAWIAVVFIHPALGRLFRARWPGGAVPEEFRAPSPCPASSAAAAAAAGGVDATCAAAGCGGLAATTSSWPAVQCCDFGPPCANGAKAWPGSCTCQCPAGWAGALCNSDSPHSLFEVALGGVSHRQWFFGGRTILIATVATVARVPHSTLEIDSTSDTRRTTKPDLRVRFRILGQTPAAAIKMAAVVASAVQAGVLGAMLAGAGVGSGFVTLSAPPSAFNGTISLCGGQALTCEAVASAQGMNFTAANGDGDIGGNSGVNVVLIVATAVTLITVTGAAILARSRTLRARAATVPSLFRALLSKDHSKGAGWKSRHRRSQPRQRPLSSQSIESDLVFLDVQDSDYRGQAGGGGGGGWRSMFQVIGANGSNVASATSPAAAQAAATAVSAAVAAVAVRAPAAATATQGPSGGNGWISQPIMPYWRSCTPELQVSSTTIRHASRPRAAVSMPSQSPVGYDSRISSLVSAGPTLAAAAPVTAYVNTTSPLPEQRRLLLEQAATASAAAGAWHDRMPAIPEIPSRTASLPPPAAILRRRSAVEYPASTAAFYSTAAVGFNDPRSSPARPRGTALSPPAEQLWEHWQTPLAALRTASPSPQATAQRGAAVAGGAPAATASASLPPGWSGRAPVSRFRFSPHVNGSAEWQRPALVGAMAAATGAGSRMASAGGPQSVFRQLRQKAREAEVRAASAPPTRVVEGALAPR